MDPRYALSPASWLSRDDYPFQSRSMMLPEGAMHYIDEGQGHPLVFVHGCPTWSFHFRKLITHLRKDYRCIALDHLGFGLSAKPERADYSPQAHVRRLAELMHRLELTGVTLVAHDYGVPIGLAWAMQADDHVRDYILFNSWLWPMNDESWVQRLNGVANNPLNLLWMRYLNASPRFFLPVLFADLHSLRRAVQNQYLEPFRLLSHRKAAFALVRSVLAESAWLQELWRSRLKITGKRSLLLWGLDDPALGEDALSRWTEALPMAQVAALQDVGNYVCEHAPARCVAEIRSFLSDASSMGAETAVTI